MLEKCVIYDIQHIYEVKRRNSIEHVFIYIYIFMNYIDKILFKYTTVQCSNEVICLSILTRRFC